MKQLLVPIDFSIESDYAMELACSIARKEDCIVDVLNVFKAPSAQMVLSEGEKENYDSEAVNLNWKRMENYLEHEKFSGVKIRMNQAEIDSNDDIADAIIDVAQKNQSELIIMGNKYVSGMLEKINGSITSTIMKGVKIPLLTVKDEIATNQFQHLLYTSDFKDIDKEPLESIAMLASLFDAQVHFLYVSTGNEPATVFEKELIFKMKQLVQKWKIADVTFNIRENDMLQSGIEEFSEDVKADLIVVGYHDDRVEKHEIQGSLAEDFIHNLNRPVLTIKF